MSRVSDSAKHSHTSPGSQHSQHSHDTRRSIHHGRFVLCEKIGSGSFGSIYRGYRADTRAPVAIKVERCDAEHPQLLYEVRLYNMLRCGVGIPAVHWSGTEGKFNVMVMDLLGSSLEDMLHQCGGRFGLKTVLQLADQMLRRVEYIHSKNVIHRDIKPDNFLLGPAPSYTLYMIDFGLAKLYRDPKTHRHIVYRENKSLTGTARYASLHTHLGIEQSRRDDLEAVGFVLVYLAKGKLPWQGLRRGRGKDKYELIREKKLSTSVERLCEGLPLQFQHYFNYVRSLWFADRPDYSKLRGWFREAMLAEGFPFDNVYEWTDSRTE